MIWVKRLLALLVITLLFVWISPLEVIAVLKNITLPLLLFLLFISFVLVFISALKWKILLSSQEREESLLRLYGLYLLGYFVNLILPSYLGGDAVRSWYLGKKHGQHESLSATVFERYSGIVAMLALALVFIWFLPDSILESIDFPLRWMIIGLAFVVVVGTLFALSPFMLKLLKFVPVVGKKCVHHGGLLQESFLVMTKQPLVLVEAFFLSFLFHSITVVNVLASAWAVGWFDAPAFELFIVLPIILIISALPLTPQGLGVQEGAFVYFLTMIGASSPQALGIALILRAKAYLLAMVGGLVWLIERDKK